MVKLVSTSVLWVASHYPLSLVPMMFLLELRAWWIKYTNSKIALTWQWRLKLYNSIVKPWNTPNAALHRQMLLGLVKDPLGTAEHSNIQTERSWPWRLNFDMIYYKNTSGAVQAKCESNANSSHGNSACSSLIWFLFHAVKKISWCQLCLSLGAIFLSCAITQRSVLYTHPLLL